MAAIFQTPAAENVLNWSAILITGGAGFVGSNFTLEWLANELSPVVVLDKLTYSGNLENLAAVLRDERLRFFQGDITDRELVKNLLQEHRPRAIVHFAAESHVDRSIVDPAEFIRTNIEGTFRLLEAAREYWSSLEDEQQRRFRFLHVSTDEVYGSLGPSDAPFTEMTPYAPNSPYAASKAASDHLVRAYHHTYGLPALTTRCSNNYGPRQFPEKLIPLAILNALKGRPIPVYGDGQNVRDWLYVTDHCDGIRTALKAGVPGQTYNLGGRQEMTNLEVVGQVCAVLDELKPASRPYENSIIFVPDRPGHDRRYAMDISRISRELGWEPRETFSTGLRKTVAWYVENVDWVARVSSGSYRDWMRTQYACIAD
jgi:dTDP-glucose 4,6-dehydratase